MGINLNLNLLKEDVVHWNEPLFASLSNYAEQSVLQVRVPDVTVDQFGFSTAGAAVGEKEPPRRWVDGIQDQQDLGRARRIVWPHEFELGLFHREDRIK